MSDEVQQALQTQERFWRDELAKLADFWRKKHAGAEAERDAAVARAEAAEAALRTTRRALDRIVHRTADGYGVAIAEKALADTDAAAQTPEGAA